jgi:tRNA threonylcarbamoyl adenosine modification protein (Sua5/YciO/YrdC/YwlC family)
MKERLDSRRPSSALVKHVAALLRNGGVAAFPTDTLYGLACSGKSREGMARLRAMKGAGREAPFILLIGESSWVSKLARRVTPVAEDLMRRYWPGPLSIVLDAAGEEQKEAGWSTGTVAVRLPDCVWCRSLCLELGEPVASTSANLAGEPPASNPAEIDRAFGDRLDMVLDGGPAREKEPSTLVDARGRKPVVLRQGILRLERGINPRMKKG